MADLKSWCPCFQLGSSLRVWPFFHANHLLVIVNDTGGWMVIPSLIASIDYHWSTIYWPVAGLMNLGLYHLLTKVIPLIPLIYWWYRPIDPSMVEPWSIPSMPRIMTQANVLWTPATTLFATFDSHFGWFMEQKLQEAPVLTCFNMLNDHQFPRICGAG